MPSIGHLPVLLLALLVAVPPGEVGPQRGGRAGGKAGQPREGKPAAGAVRVPRLPAALGEENGVYGTVYPQPLDVTLDARPVHQDRDGGCDQVLLDLAGCPSGGYAAVWGDGRDGRPGLYLGILDGEGERPTPEVPVSDPPGTAEQLEPALAVGAGGEVALVWFEKGGGIPQAQLRFFDPDEARWSGRIPLGSGTFRKALKGEIPPPGPAGGRGALAGPQRTAPGFPRLPAVAWASDGRAIAVWQESGRVLAQSFDARHYPEEKPVRLNPGGSFAQDRPRIVVDRKGRALCAWTTAEGVRICTVGPGQALVRRPVGPGSLLALAADPRGGWWLLVRQEGQLALRHLDAAGRPDRPEVGAEAGTGVAADLALWGDGIALVLEHPAEGADEEGTGAEEAPRRIAIHRLDPDGRPRRPQPIVFRASGRRRGLCAVSEGPAADRLLVAWTDDREGDADVYYAQLAREEQAELRITAPRRWNSDQGTANQVPGGIASNGERALVVWRDERHSAGHVWLRAVDADGGFLFDERPVGEPGSAPSRERSQRHPAAAMQADGRFLVVWKERPDGAGSWRLQAQPFGAEGIPLSAPLEVDPGQHASPEWPADAAALAGNRGYLVAWIRPEMGPMARRVSLSGRLEGEAWGLSERSGEGAARPSVARLDDERLVVLWDAEAASKGLRRLAGRFVREDARPLGSPLTFLYGGGGGDLDPSVAPGVDGGFVVAWTTRDGPSRDVVARFHDRLGRGMGPPLALSVLRNEQAQGDIARLADGSWVVAWEDDLSGNEHVVARRIGRDQRTLGPRVTLDLFESDLVEARHAPAVAALGEGFATVWSDSSRSKGSDAFLRILGEDFDAGVEEPALVEQD